MQQPQQMPWWRRLFAHSKYAIDGSENKPQFWNCTRRILLYVVAALFIMANLWMLYAAMFSLPSWFLESYSNPMVHSSPSIHLISITTRPLPDVALVCIDSITKYMPNSTVYLHITVEENIPPAAAEERKGILADQIQLFKSKGLDINLIFHNDTKSDFEGTPLEAIGITQRHVGGYYGVKPHFYLPAHASDLYRSLTMFKHGGIYMDWNFILLRDLQPLFHMYGPNILVPEMIDETLRDCRGIQMTNAWIAIEPNHLLMKQYLILFANYIKSDGPNYVFPWDETPKFGGYWAKYGPEALTVVHKKQCQSSYPPLLVNEIPENIEESNSDQQDAFLKSYPENDDRYRYTIISRKYLMPCHFNYDDCDCLIKYDSSVFNDTQKFPRFTEKMKQLQGAYQLHVFGELKDRWLEHAEKGNKYPVMQYVHEKSCKYLCDVKMLRKIVEDAKSLTKS